MFENFKQKRAKKKEVKQRYKQFLISPWTHPIQFIVLAVLVGLFSYFGFLIIAALYYLLTQVWSFMNEGWHNLVPDDNTRHLIRNVSEGLLGGLLGQTIAFNYYRKVVKKGKPNLIDKLVLKLRIPSPYDDKIAGPVGIGLNWLAVILFAIPGFLIGLEAIHLLEKGISWVNNHEVAPVNASLWTKTQLTVTSEYQQKIIGYFAAFIFGRRAALGVMNDIQERLVTIRICQDKPLRWYHSPVYKARYNLVKDDGVQHEMKGGIENILIKVGMGIGFVLAAFGWFVLNYVAYGQVNVDKLNQALQVIEATLVAMILLTLLVWLGKKLYRRLQEIPI